MRSVRTRRKRGCISDYELRYEVLLAADYGFRSAVNSGDEETIQSVLENHGSRIGAAVTALLGTDLTLRAVSLTGSIDQFPVTLQQVVPRLAQQPQGSQIAVMEGIPYQFVMVPMRAPVVIGWVLMGFRIDQSRADEMRQLLSVHVALMVKAPGGAMTLPVSTLPKDAQALLLASGGAAGELQTAEGTLQARSSPLDSVGGRGALAAAAVGGRGGGPQSAAAGVAGHHHRGGCAAVCRGHGPGGATARHAAALLAGGHAAPVAW